MATTYDWYTIMYLWMDVTDTAWTAMYFISFHLVANVLVFQLTAALFIDAFLSFHDKRWAEDGSLLGEHEPAAQGSGGAAPPVAFGRVGDVGDGRRWSYKSEASASAAPYAPSPTPSEAAAEQQQQRGGGGQQLRRSASSPAQRRRSGRGGGFPSPAALPPHSASYTASVI